MSDKEIYKQFRECILLDMIDYIQKTYSELSFEERLRIYNEWRGYVISEKLVDAELGKMDIQIKEALNSPL